MAINASPLLELLTAAFVPRETCPQLLQRVQWAEAVRLSPEEIKCPTMGQAAAGRKAFGSANPEVRGFRKGTDMGNGSAFTGSQFPDKRLLRYSNHP